MNYSAIPTFVYSDRKRRVLDFVNGLLNGIAQGFGLHHLLSIGWLWLFVFCGIQVDHVFGMMLDLMFELTSVHASKSELDF